MFNNVSGHFCCNFVPSEGAGILCFVLFFGVFCCCECVFVMGVGGVTAV